MTVSSKTLKEPKETKEGSKKIENKKEPCSSDFTAESKLEP